MTIHAPLRMSGSGMPGLIYHPGQPYIPQVLYAQHKRNRISYKKFLTIEDLNKGKRNEHLLPDG